MIDSLGGLLTILVIIFLVGVPLFLLFINPKGTAKSDSSILSGNSNLQWISAELGRIAINPEQVIEEFLHGEYYDRRTAAVEALCDYCESNPSTKAVIEEFGATRDKLQDLYNRLLVGGAGQWIGSHWVAASSIAYPQTLRFLLAHPPMDKDSLMHACFLMIEHFERGTPLATYEPSASMLKKKKTRKRPG